MSAVDVTMVTKEQRLYNVAVWMSENIDFNGCKAEAIKAWPLLAAQGKIISLVHLKVAFY